MGTGEDVAVRADDDTAACAALHLILAVPGPLRVDHLLGSDDHHAGADQVGHLLGAQGTAGSRSRGDGAIRAAGAADRRGRHLLDDYLAAAADLCAHKAACKAHGSCQNQRHGAAGDALAVDLLLFLGLFRLGLLHRMLRGRGAACAAVALRSAVLRFRLRVIVLVGGVHAAAAHIGVTGAACRVIGRGIVVFPFVLIHLDTSFPEKALSPGNCAPWNCSYCIHQL